MVDPVSAYAFTIRDRGESALASDVAPSGGRNSIKFSDVLSDFVKETNDLQKVADASLEDFAAGKADSIHDVMLSMTKADLSFRLMLEVKNKLVEAYTEVMRIQA